MHLKSAACSAALTLAALCSAQSSHAQAQTLFASANYAIDQISSSGNVSTFATAVNNPVGLAFDSAGDLFEANYGNGKINEFTSTGGVLSSTPTLFASLRKVNGLAFDSSGDLFANNNNSIVEYASTGGVLSSTATPFASGLATPNGLTIDSSGNLFVTDSSGNIDKFTPQGVESTFATAPAYGQSQLAFDSKGDLFLGSSGDGNIYEFASTSGVLSSTSTLFATGLTAPDAMTFNSSGNLFVSDTNGNIDEFTPQAVESTFTNTGGEAVGMAFRPMAAVPEANTLIGLGGLVLGGACLGLRRRKSQSPIA